MMAIKRILTLALLFFLTGNIMAQGTTDLSCRSSISSGRDFWVGLIRNGGDQLLQQLKVIAIGDTSCTITVTNPLTTWQQTATLTAGSSASIDIPVSTFSTQYSVIENKGIHITATANIQLILQCTKLASSDATAIIPTDALSTRYIVLDYPTDPTCNSDTCGASITIVATQPNTTIHYTPPCPLSNAPASIVGTPVQHTFTFAGQTLALLANDANTSLSGMEITADHPIAVFQGNQLASVPQSSPNSGDLMYEQASPVEHWGKEFVLIPTINRSAGDRVRVVADTACTFTLSTGGTYTLTAGGVEEFDLPANAPCILTATKPVSVGILCRSSIWGSELGDASLLMVPPTSRGVCHASFVTLATEQIYAWYIAVTTDNPSGMTLDGNDVSSSFQPIGSSPYSYARINIGSGTHTLDNTGGTFTAWTYGVGNVESYMYNLGYAVRPPVQIIQRDTLFYNDSICQGHNYNGYGFNINVRQIQNPGTYVFADSTVDDYLIHYQMLTLTVLPNIESSETRSIVCGDTLFYHGDTLTLAGDYPYLFTASNGCDSVVTLHLVYETIGLRASATTVCSNEEVTLTATGTQVFRWASLPHDASLDTQQNRNPVTVHPTTTTIYKLLDESGFPVATVAVSVESEPMVCWNLSRPYIDYDNPVVIFTDCTYNAASSDWTFSDGVTANTQRVMRQFQHPLPDSVTVTLTSCTPLGCCVDTTFSVPTKLRSIWFPNVFTPNESTNNLFGGYTSIEIAEYHLSVFNRWGLELWNGHNINDFWDGTHEGEPMPQGAYVYQWELKDIYGQLQNGIGTILLLR